MKIRTRFAGSLFVTVALIFFCGCASWRGQQTMTGDYKKMADLQQRKASAMKAEEPALPADFEATAETREHMGDAYIRQGNYAAAFTEYQRSLEKDPLRLTARYKAGMLFLGRGLPEEAIAEFELILAKDPHNASVYYGRGRARFLQKKMDLAKSDLDEAVKLNDKLWQAHVLLGVVFDAGRYYSEAEEEYRKALAIQSDSAAVYNNLGVSLYLNGQFDKSAEAFLKAFNISPDNRRICNNLGLSLYRLGNSGDALEAFKKGGNEAAAYNNIGYLQMKDKKYKEALAALEKAIELNPSYYVRAQKNLNKVKAALNEADSNQDKP